MMPKNFYSIGRAGSYLYGIDIDDCIRQAMEVARQIREDAYDYQYHAKIIDFRIKC